MIELNLSQVTDIVCHDNCSDGTVSAMLLHDALPSARIRFCQYGISHEKLEVRPNLRRKHDDEIRHAADIARLIGIRDTWQKHDPDWLSACELGETIRFFSQDSWLIEAPFARDRLNWWAARRSVGQRLVEKQHVTLRKVLEGAYRFTSPAGTRVVLFSGTKLTSDACEVVKEMADLIVGFDYFAVEDGQASLGYSLRSYASSNFDCSTFCKTLGGGGHSKAAGFSVRFDPALGTGDPYSIFQTRLREYEAAAGV